MSLPDDLRYHREFHWRSIRERRIRNIVALSVAIALLVFSAYQGEEASFGSTAGKVWGAVTLLLLALSFALFGIVNDSTERIRVAANRDGLFILEALGEYGDTRDSSIDRAVKPLMRSVASHLKAGEPIPDNIRSEAIRFAELALNRPAEATYELAYKTAGLRARRR